MDYMPFSLEGELLNEIEGQKVYRFQKKIHL
ncbi:hypothetical protein CLV93_1011 [Prolixibacter denitrificans]|uniref:Uncharacterized protein n=1 Tax=Prolixibacter denitrificans TaxID=1541063 RepID=A0A2P8CJD1_9BACT|nr:hypothetical protein CLV93_1011 [Prolixibacter denitrificans]